jgi:hypothetical protein
MAATNTLATPEARNCSDQTTTALALHRNRIPVMARVHSPAARGADQAPHDGAEHHPGHEEYPAKRNGGRWPTPIRMARYVEPQTVHTSR